jgi:chromate transporter
MHQTPQTSSQGPSSLYELFWAFNWIALQGFGGVMGVMQRELVDRRKWLSNQELLELWSVAQVLPGPNMGNLSLIIGERYLGVRGAIAAGLGLFVIPFFLLMLLAWGYAQASDYPAVAGALKAVGVVVIALIVATVLKMTLSLHEHPMGFLICQMWIALTLIGVLLLKWSLLGVLAVLGGASCVWTYRCLTRQMQSNE